LAGFFVRLPRNGHFFLIVNRKKYIFIQSHFLATWRLEFKKKLGVLVSLISYVASWFSLLGVPWCLKI
jgi:hypothetical protein